ncbi:unnamed protein product, partial [Prorocentrum cordatum]
SLSGFSGPGVGGGSGLHGDATPARQRCLARVAESVSQLAPPPGDLVLAALQELQVALSRDGSLSTKTEAMGVSRLSLPPSGNRPAALEQPLESEAHDSADRDMSSMVLPGAEVLQQKLDIGINGALHLGPFLRGRRWLAAAVSRLLDAGAVDLVRDPSEVIDERASQSAADRAGLLPSTGIVDRQTCAGSAAEAHLEHVDNFASLSLGRDTAARMKGD